jgi:hypothetical protein
VSFNSLNSIHRGGLDEQKPLDEPKWIERLVLSLPK